MDRKYQVFVSSTYEDLIEERQEVLRSLLELDCIPSAMEFFPAASEDQWSLITRTIDRSDYYVVIVGGKYGSIASSGLSYTEQEFEYAVAQGKPVIAFLHRDPLLLSASKTELDPDRRQQLDAFRSKLKQRLCKFWMSPIELGAVVSRSLARVMHDRPGVGWVRADLVPDTNTENLVDVLQARVAELTRKIEQYADSYEEFDGATLLRTYSQPVVLIGPRNVGKTSLLYRWMTEPITESPFPTATHTTTQVPVVTVDQEEVRADFWKTQPRFPGMVHLAVRVWDTPGEVHAQKLVRQACVTETVRTRNEFSADLGVVIICMFNAEDAYRGLSGSTREYYNDAFFRSLYESIMTGAIAVHKVILIFNKIDLLREYHPMASDDELRVLCLESLGEVLEPFSKLCRPDRFFVMVSTILPDNEGRLHMGPAQALIEAIRELASVLGLKRFMPGLII